MTVLKIVLGLITAFALTVGGFVAGMLISQARAATGQLRQITQAQGQQFLETPAPGATLPTNPRRGRWSRGWGMMDPGYAPTEEWEHGWMMDPNYTPQGQQGWGMHDWNNNQGGMHGGMMGGSGWQTNPSWNGTPSVPNSSQAYSTASSSVSYKKDVQPIFTARCVACHGGTNGLYLDSYENVLRGGIHGQVVIPGEVYSSRLANYVYSGYMPFRNTPLNSTEIQVILDWIAAGALNN